MPGLKTLPDTITLTSLILSSDTNTSVPIYALVMFALIIKIASLRVFPER